MNTSLSSMSYDENKYTNEMCSNINYEKLLRDALKTENENIIRFVFCSNSQKIDICNILEKFEKTDVSDSLVADIAAFIMRNQSKKHNFLGNDAIECLKRMSQRNIGNQKFVIIKSILNSIEESPSVLQHSDIKNISKPLIQKPEIKTQHNLESIFEKDDDNQQYDNDKNDTDTVGAIDDLKQYLDERLSSKGGDSEISISSTSAPRDFSYSKSSDGSSLIINRMGNFLKGGAKQKNVKMNKPRDKKKRINNKHIEMVEGNRKMMTYSEMSENGATEMSELSLSAKNQKEKFNKLATNKIFRILDQMRDNNEIDNETLLWISSEKIKEKMSEGNVKKNTSELDMLANLLHNITRDNLNDIVKKERENLGKIRELNDSDREIEQSVSKKYSKNKGKKEFGVKKTDINKKYSSPNPLDNSDLYETPSDKLESESSQNGTQTKNNATQSLDTKSDPSDAKNVSMTDDDSLDSLTSERILDDIINSDDGSELSKLEISSTEISESSDSEQSESGDADDTSLSLSSESQDDMGTQTSQYSDFSQDDD
jgi:hypothetical protein